MGQIYNRLRRRNSYLDQSEIGLVESEKNLIDNLEVEENILRLHLRCRKHNK